MSDEQRKVSVDTCEAVHKGVDKTLTSIEDRLRSIENYGKAILLAMTIGIFMQFAGLSKPVASPAAWAGPVK